MIVVVAPLILLALKCVVVFGRLWLPPLLAASKPTKSVVLKKDAERNDDAAPRPRVGPTECARVRHAFR